jgi:hypothetical protein
MGKGSRMSLHSRSWHGARHGRWGCGDVQWAAAQWQCARAAGWRVGERRVAPTKPCSHHAQRRLGVVLDPLDPGRSRRAVRRGTTAWVDVTSVTSQVSARSDATKFNVTLFDHQKLEISELK